MKDIFESGEIFEAYAVIDLCYYGLQELQKELNKPKIPLYVMIDQATGFDKAQAKENKETAVELLEQIIKAKKIIEADYSNDEKMIDKIQILIKNKHYENTKSKFIKVVR